jgi:signal transduction histidine kinase
MKGSWVTTFAVSGVLFLLTLFLGLQYTWLRQAGEAERERMQRRVEVDARNFANDLNREMQAAYFNFQTDAAGWETGNWTEFNERYDHWKSSTQYPELIREFIYFGKGAVRPLRYDPAARAFVTAELHANVLALQQLLNDPRTYRTFYEDEFALVMPIHEPEKEFEKIVLRRTHVAEPPKFVMPEARGHLVIMLDKGTVTDRILPELSAKHFPDGDYRVAVNDRQNEPIYASASMSGEPDASLGVFDLSPDRLFFVGDRRTVARMRTAEKRQSVVVSESIQSKIFSHTEVTPDGVKQGSFAIAVQPRVREMPANGSDVRTAAVSTQNNGLNQWTLNVQHVAGSIDNYSQNEFQKFFAIGFGLYILLIGAIVAIVLSAMKSKRYAQRQIDFVSSVSHEFRTPLAVIYSASENLADGVAHDREQVERYGNLIKGEGRKLSAMVEQILQFAGARSGRKKYNVAPGSPAAAVDAAIRECSPILEEKGFEVETNIDENLPVINIDHEAISTAVQNLISNSVKYSNGSRWIRVSASNGGGTVKLSVTDRGIGVAGDDLRHIFEPFYRARSVVDAQIHGNGLGLALVKDIAEAHRGTVRAKSEVGKGSEFTIELPVVTIHA